MEKWNIWEGDSPNPSRMRAMLRASSLINCDGMHIVKTFEVDTKEEAGAVFDEYVKAAREADG
jgi:hypothetical protein